MALVLRSLAERPGADFNCRVLDSATTPWGQDATSWYVLWEALIAVNSMSVRKGKGGVAVGIGEFFRLSIWWCSV